MTSELPIRNPTPDIIPAEDIPISRDTSISYYDSAPRSRSHISRPHFRRRATSPPLLPTISSHTDFFVPSPSPNKTDRVVLLEPFNNEAYITTHAATSYDFNHWLPLLALAAPETWYTLSVSAKTIPCIQTPANQPLLAPPNAVWQPVENARPVGLRMPRISAAAALKPRPSPSPTIPVKNEDGSRIEPEPELIYLTIQSTIAGHHTHLSRFRRYRSPSPEHALPDLAGDSLIGKTIYKVVRAGSREEAAASAYYAAGGG